MAQKHRFHQQRNKRFAGPPAPRREAPPAYEPKPPVEYGKMFMVIEDASKQTFEFKDGEWVPFPLSIAECKREGLVKEPPKKSTSAPATKFGCPSPASSSLSSTLSNSGYKVGPDSDATHRQKGRTWTIPF